MKRIKSVLIIFSLTIIAFILSGCFSFSSIANNSYFTINGPSEVVVGESITLTATNSKGVEISDVIWVSASPEIATVENGVVTGVSAGKVSIIVRADDDEKSEKVGRTYITVINEKTVFTDEAPEKIFLYGSNKMIVGQAQVLEVNTTPINASQSVKWASSNEDVLKVEGNGVIRAVGEGDAFISCYSAVNNKVSSSKHIQVVNREKYNNYEDQMVNVIEKSVDSILGIANYQLGKNDEFAISSVGSGFVYKCYPVVNDIIMRDYELDKQYEKYYYYLITNRHVVQGSDKLAVYFYSSDKEVPATLIHYDSKVDMAVLGFYYDEFIKPLNFADSSVLQSGNTVIAIGNPEGFEFSSSATSGIVSYPLRYVSEDTDGDNVNDWDSAYIQHDAAINPGNSGGPLLNMYGDVIGINTMKFASYDIDNMGFSIPSSTVLELIPYLEKSLTPTRAALGVQVIAVRDLIKGGLINNEEYASAKGLEVGLFVQSVSENSVAYIGGIKANDVIISFNNVELKSSIQLRAELNKVIVGNGSPIEVCVIRNGEKVTLTLEF